MRKFVLLFAALGMVAYLAIPAFAATNTQFVEGKITPTKSGTATKPAGHTIFVQVSSKNDDGSQVSPNKRTVLTFGKEFEFHGDALPSCTAAKLDAGGLGACPSKTKVGTGKTHAVSGAAEVTPPVSAFNGPKGKSILLFVGDPLQKTIEGKLSGGKGKPKTLTFDVPNEAINPAGNVFFSLDLFNTTIKASGKDKNGKTVPYVTTTGCPKGGIPLKAQFTYATKANFPNLPDNLTPPGTGFTANTKIKCVAGK